MKVKRVVWVLAVLAVVPVGMYGVNNLRLGDGRSVGMGGNEVVTTALLNPSLVALSGERRAGISYYNRYALQELGTLSGYVYLPNATLSLGAHCSSFGYDAYRETLFRVMLGKRLDSRWTLGIGVQYAFLQTELFEESPAQVSADVGLIYTASDKLLISAAVINFPSATFGYEGEEQPAFSAYLVEAGFQWEVFEQVFICSTLEWTEEGGTGVHLGMEYRPYEEFAVRVGVRGMPWLPAMGLGYSFGNVRVDASAVYHPTLGVSMGAGISFSF